MFGDRQSKVYQPTVKGLLTDSQRIVKGLSTDSERFINKRSKIFSSPYIIDHEYVVFYRR